MELSFSPSSFFHFPLMAHLGFPVFASLLALLLSCGALCSQEFGGARGTFQEIAKRYEVQEQSPAPGWALRKDKPLFQIAWLSDMHITSLEKREYHRKLLKQIREDLKPVAVLFSGDNWGMGADDAERSRGFRQFLEQSLGKEGEEDSVEAIAIPGDNWPLEAAFASRQFAFTLGGFRFVAFAPDCGGRANGCTLHARESLQWLEEELRRAAVAGQPVIYIQHEPLLPPSTLDAPEVSGMLDKAPQAFLALAGHMHLDLEFTKGHWRQWICPSSGHSHRPGFRLLSFYPDCVVSQAWEESPDPDDGGRYRPVPKYLRAPVPVRCRNGLFAVEAYDAVDVSRREHNPYREDLELDAEVERVTRAMVDYALQYVVQQARKKK